MPWVHRLATIAIPFAALAACAATPRDALNAASAGMEQVQAWEPAGASRTLWRAKPLGVGVIAPETGDTALCAGVTEGAANTR